jgi:hypothetical protein
MASYLLQPIPDVSSDQRESAEIAKLIRKLRWIGHEDEAKSMEQQFLLLSSTHRVSVLSEPNSTD